MLSLALVTGCGSTRSLHDYGSSVSWAADGTLYFTAYPTGDDAYAYSFESINMPYQLLPEGEVTQIDFEALRDCWVADTIQAVEPGRVIIAGECLFELSYMAVSYDLRSGTAEVIGDWSVKGWDGLAMWSAWSPSVPNEAGAQGWLSYSFAGCSSVARVDHFLLVPWEPFQDRFMIDRRDKVGSQDFECWRGFRAGQIVVSSAGVVAMLATVDRVPTLFVYDPATEELSELPLATEATGLSFCGPDGGIAVATHGDEPAIVLIDPISGDSQTIVDGAFDQISCAPDGTTIAVIDASTRGDVRLLPI
ncbi:hypothetical protein ACFQ3B_14825 [Stackebrandtia endophytica]|nr:hypothetical protein [Stackebrandtia endophytica]